MISLVQTSQNRVKELLRYVESLNAQENIDFSKIQLIFVDQGDSKEALKNLNPQIHFVYIKYKPSSLSHARNIGLKYVKGEYIAFPDDDCWYEPDTLKKVLEAFSEGHIGVIAKGTDEKGILTNDFPLKRQYITLYNHCGAISYTMFFKYIPSLKFDENIGIGSPFKLSSGEETDYLMQVIYKNGANIIFDPNIIVHHPNFNSCNFKDNFVKQYEYARGWGYILKKHHYPFSVKCKSFIRPLCGILFGVLTLNFARMKHSSYLLIGRIEGYNFKAENNGKNKYNSSSL